MKTLLAIGLLILSGCTVMKDHVLVNTETGLGLAVAQNPGTGLYEGRLGYCRHELAVVTTNVDVLTEMQFKNLFSFTGGPSLYQRMAVGKEACGAAMPLFIKNPDGTVNQDLVAAFIKYYTAPRTNK